MVVLAVFLVVAAARAVAGIIYQEMYQGIALPDIFRRMQVAPGFS